MTLRTLVVGWDSVSWDYLDPLLREGKLPNFKSLLKAGYSGVLRSTMPPITPAAWSSLATGKFPQKHGVYDWTWRSGGQIQAARSSDLHGTPFWLRLNAQQVRVGLVNIPLTYPPGPVDGFIVCGFGAPDPPAQITHPLSLLAEIETEFGSYTPTVSLEQARDLRRDEGYNALYKEEAQVQAAHVQIALYLAARYPVDVLAINLMLFDHMNHRAKDLRLVEASLLEMDHQLGLLLDGFAPDDVVLLSDHGARRVEGLFLLADWLQDRGYLIRQRKRDQTMQELNYLLLRYLIDGWGLAGLSEKIVRAVLRRSLPHLPRTLTANFWRSVQTRARRAFDHYWFEEDVDAETSPVLNARNVGTIYMNRRAEFLWQSATPEETANSLAEELRRVRIPATDTPLFQQVLTAADIYGPQASGTPPDLILDFYNSGFSLHTNKGIGLIERYPHFAFLADNPEADVWHGDHQPDGIFLFSGPSFHRDHSPEPAHLVDIPATLLHLYRVPIPADYDGRVLTTALVEDVPVKMQAGDNLAQSASESTIVSEEETNQVLSHLRALGYVD